MRKNQPFWLNLFLIVFLLCLALVPRLFLLSLKGFEIFNADQAVIGLMGKHILEGKPMVYFYGQSYMGSLESFMAALIYAGIGISRFSTQLAPLIFYFLFLIVNFFLLKRVFGLGVSLIANSLLALSSPELSRLSVTALGGYPETLFFGSLTLWGLVDYLESGRKKVLFLSGLAAGVGFWVNNLILFYFLAIGIFWFLRSEFWKKSYPSFRWRKLFLLEDFNLPPLVKGVCLAIHLGLGLFLLWQIVSFFTGSVEWTFGALKIKAASPPFHVKQMKKILLLLLIELTLLCFFLLEFKKIGQRVKRIFPLAGGFLLGASPVWLYSFLGGEGHRVIHHSGIVYAKNLPSQFQTVLWKGVLGSVLGIPVESLMAWSGLPTFQAWGILFLCAVLLGVFAAANGKELKNLLRFSPDAYSYQIFPLLLAFTVLGGCLFSTLESNRYLTPLYFSLSLLFALALSQGKRVLKIVAGFLFAMLLAHHAYAHYRFIEALPDHSEYQQAYASVIRLLDEKGIRGGYANYWNSYMITFETRERIIIAPYRSQDRYPSYTKYVGQLDRVAYIFKEEDAGWKEFQKKADRKQVPYEKAWQKPFVIYIIDQSERSPR